MKADAYLTLIIFVLFEQYFITHWTTGSRIVWVKNTYARVVRRIDRSHYIKLKLNIENISNYNANFYPMKTTGTGNYRENLHYLWKKITKKPYVCCG